MPKACPGRTPADDATARMARRGLSDCEHALPGQQERSLADTGNATQGRHSRPPAAAGASGVAGGAGMAGMARMVGC